MENFKVEILKHPTDEDWKWVKLLAFNTMGQQFLMDKDLSLALKKKYLKSEHSPIRYLQFIIKLDGIPYCNSVHFTRHKYGVEHFVSYREMIVKTSMIERRLRKMLLSRILCG